MGGTKDDDTAVNELYFSLVGKDHICSNSKPSSGLVAHMKKVEKSKRHDVYFRCFEIVTILFFACTLTYAYKCIWDLRDEVMRLKIDLDAKIAPQSDANDKFIDLTRNEYDVIVPDAGPLLKFDEEDDSEEDEGSVYKRKREVRYSDENTSDRSAGSNEKGKTLTKSSEEFYPEFPLMTSQKDSAIRNSILTTRKPHGSHRKSKKYHRHMVSAEKFFTEIESTTSTPIQIRQSRTKLTDSSESGSGRHSLERKPLLHVYGSKESITREEAMRRSNTAYNLTPEKIPQLAIRLKQANGSGQDLSASEELGDSITYNMVTVHFAADTSHYSRERDTHYLGNGRMQTKSSIYKDWKPAHWTHGMEVSKYFHLNQGKVTVSVTGIYLIYAQIQYSNVQEVNGYAVVRNRQTVVQCITTSIHPDKNEVKSNTCDTSTTILLQANDKIYIQDLHHGRHVVLTPEKSYFGLILLSPFKLGGFPSASGEGNDTDTSCTNFKQVATGNPTNSQNSPDPVERTVSRPTYMDCEYLGSSSSDSDAKPQNIRVN